MYENNSNACRICLKSHSTLDIFLTMANGDLVANLLIDLAGIKVSLNDPDPIPRQICDACYSNLITAHEICKQIRDSDNLLRQMHDIQRNDDNGAKVQLTTEHDLSFFIDFIKTEAVHEEAVNVIESIVLPVERLETIKTETIEDSTLPSQKISEAVVEPILPTKMNYNCCMCPEYFDDFELLKQHALKTHNKKWHGILKGAVQCDLCGKKYKTAVQLRQHKTKYKEMVACDVCGAMVQRHGMGAHLKWHKGEEVECDICHKMYKKVYIHEHKTKVHCAEKLFKCDLCLKVFAIKNQLRQHMGRTHDPNYKAPINAICTICHYEFSSRVNLRRHMFIHSGQKRYSCEHCTVSFMHRTDWLRHTWSHTGSPHSCPKCNKYMNRPSQLKAHQAVGCGNQVRNARPRSTVAQRK